jgi:hypothetical protein
MPNTQTETKTALQDRIDELEETLEQIGDKADDALDPECTREDLVGYLKDIADLAAGEEPDEDEDDTEDEDTGEE